MHRIKPCTENVLINNQTKSCNQILYILCLAFPKHAPSESLNNALLSKTLGGHNEVESSGHDNLYHSRVYSSYKASLTHWSGAVGGMMCPMCKWLSECRIACHREPLRGPMSSCVWLQNGLLSLSLDLSLSLFVFVAAEWPFSLVFVCE